MSQYEWKLRFEINNKHFIGFKIWLTHLVLSKKYRENDGAKFKKSVIALIRLPLNISLIWYDSSLFWALGGFVAQTYL